jgi:hypothetical protein
MKRQAPHETQQPQLQPPQPAQAAHALQPPTLQPRQPLQPPQPLPQALHPRQPLQPRWAYCWPGTLTSLSKTKNVPKLTSNISSSLRVNCGGVSRNCTSGVGPTAPVAGAPPVIAMDMPTTPATGTAFFRCFCFVCGIAKPPRLLVNATKPSPTALFIVGPARTPCKIVASHAVRASLLQAHRGAFEVATGKAVHKRASAQLVPRCRDTASVLVLRPLRRYAGQQSWAKSKCGRFKCGICDDLAGSIGRNTHG